LDQEPEINELLQIRRDKLNELRELGVDPFGSKYDRTHYAADILRDYNEKTNEELETIGAEVSIAGRIMQKRGMGKASFAHIQDITGKIQVYIRADSIDEKLYAAFSILDIGDIIGMRS